MIELLGRLGPTARTTLLMAAERAINHALQFDPATRAKLESLEGSVLAVELVDSNWQVAVTTEANQIRLLGYSEQPTAQVLANSGDLLAWLMAGDDSLADHNIEVRGSTQLLQTWQELFTQLDIDWEDWLNHHLGDLLGHSLATGLRETWFWGRERGKNISRQLLEFAVEEQELVPNRALFDDLRQRSQTLRLDLDRLEARGRRLARILSAAKAP